MKKRPAAVFPALLLILSWGMPAGVGAQEFNHQKSWVMDLSHADVSFSVRVLGVFAITGEFERLHGGLVFNESCHATDITFNIDSASVTTRDTALDRVLRSPALLNTENFPAITFASNQVVLHQEDPGLITGQLDLNGVTREVSFVLKHNPGSLDELLATSSRLEATVMISRKAFGITALPVAVSDNIDITVIMSARPEYIALADAHNQDNI